MSQDSDVFVCRAQYHPGTGEYLPLTGASSLTEAARRAEGGGAGGFLGGFLGCGDAYAEAIGADEEGAGRKRRRLSRFAEAAARLNPSAAPERMPCREKERAEVTAALRAAVREGGLGASLYLSGTPGTGKTATVRHALRTLAAEKDLPPFRAVELNGMKLSSPHQARDAPEMRPRCAPDAFEMRPRCAQDAPVVGQRATRSA